MECDYCSKEAITSSYGKNYCKEHFNMYFRGRVKSVIDKFHIKGRMAVALSGGKDSATVMHVLHILGMEIVPFHINLDIPSYSKSSREACRQLCDSLGYKLEVINLQDYGISLENEEKACSVCGTAKRYLMNRFAYENECKYVATGHNLSDVVTFAMNNLANVNIMNFRGNKPYLEGKEEYRMVAKIKPLFYLKDDECMNYVSINKIPYTKEICPHQKEAPTIKIKEWLHEIEEKRNGTMLNMAKSFWKIEDMIKEEVKLRRCSICGYPSYGKICKFCKIRKKHENFS